MIFKFPCPKCKQRLEVPEEMAGKPVACPACAHQFKIPVPASHGGPKPTPLARLKPPPPKKPQPLAPLPEESEPSATLRSPSAEPERDVHEEVAELLDAFDPDRFAPPEPIAEEPPPTPDPRENTQPTEEAVGEQTKPTRKGRWPRTKPTWLMAIVASVVLVALLLGGGIWLSIRHKRQRPPSPRILRVEVPKPAVIVRDEATCYRDLGTMALGDLPLTARRAAGLLEYLASFPNGEHRQEALLFAVKESSRALEADDKLPADAVEQYAQVGRIAANEILLQPRKHRNDAMDGLCRLAIRLCWHERDPKNLTLAKRIIEADKDAPVRNASVCLGMLAGDTPPEFRQYAEHRLYELALQADPKQWTDDWANTAYQVAMRFGEDPNSDAQELVRLAVGFHDTGRNEKALDLVRSVVRTSLSGDGREVARRWLLCWDPAEATKVRDSILAKAEAEYRRKLPSVLQTINRRELAHRLGLPWPVPPTPKITPDEAIDARLDGVKTAVAKAFPESQLAEVAADAAKRYVPYKVGEEVSVTIQRGSVRETVKGRYYSRTPGHARIGDRDVVLGDLSEDEQIRFDAGACERKRRELIDTQTNAFTRHRDVYRERLLAKVRAEAPAKAGYVWHEGQWQDPQVIFSQGLNEVAESASEALRKKLMEEMLAAAGFHAIGGQWVPIPPRIVR